jgi:DNA excision repair protein ERCC-2
MAKPKKISISVTEFAVPAPRRGSIDAYSGFGRGQQLGIELHQKVQLARAKIYPNYRAEVMTEHEFISGEFNFEVSGRIDGVFEKTTGNTDKTVAIEGHSQNSLDEYSVDDIQKNLADIFSEFDDEKSNEDTVHTATFKIEEIKSSFNIFELSKRIRDSGIDHPYCLQLLTYGYIHWLKHQEKPKLNLHLISSRTQETLNIELKLDITKYEDWLHRRLAELVEEARLAEKRVKRRKKAAEDFQFPFAQPRSGQIELIQTIEDGMKDNQPMLLQAPTGLGKTVGVLYPTLQEALKRGQKVIYLTPKNSQHAVAEEAIEKLQESGANIKGMTLTAKSKMCFKNEPLCNPEYCEYAKDHYTKVAENKLLEKLAKKKRLSAQVFKNTAEEFQCCPFELQLDAAQDVDTVICDYNYVFAPRSAFGRLASSGLISKGKPNLVIDEAHNLPARAMDYYSPSLSVFTLEKMRSDLHLIPLTYRRQVDDLFDDCIGVVKSAAPAGLTAAAKIRPPVDDFLVQDAELRTFLSTYLNSDVDIQPGDPVMRLCFYWSEFTAALEYVNGEHPEFFTTFHPNPACIKITCCDASEMLKDCYKEYANVVGFSATLKPFAYYSQMSGLKTDNLKTAEFISPFPKTNRKLLIIPQISSKYSERTRNYPKIAEAINKLVSLRRGNYIAFFPSFDFMERVLALFYPPKGMQILKQERSMKRDEIDDVLNILKEGDSANVLFAVQGGVFSEGVDYAGEMIIGAFVVGPPLPNFDLERESMRGYYEEHYQSGFDFAYVYPAMAKAIQAAGRVIRSEKDKGIIILMDNRFIQSSFAKAMPQDWFVNSPQEAVSAQILQDVTNFWQGHE